MAEGGGKYDALSRERLIALLEKSDREKKLGLVWERDAIDGDTRAVEAAFVAATPIQELAKKGGTGVPVTRFKGPLSS